MGIINVLDQQTINQIAAGEVIARPASVVKELVENAIDAGATTITIDIKNGGLDLIRITDNGKGIGRDDVKIAFQRHTTSKIKDAADLFTVSSLGFRGEALSSIAAVARVELLTKTKDAITGTAYVVEGGKEVSLSDAGLPDGTTFIVQNLFFNTPVRKKFLKSTMGEGMAVVDVVEHMALSMPQIAFRLTVNNQPRLITSGNGKLKDVIYQVYGRDVAKHLLPVNTRLRGFGITGFIGEPIVSRGNRSFEVYFINGRFIKSPMIGKAIEEAFKPFMMTRKYPFCVLAMTIPVDLLDVNVHPAKQEIRFMQEDVLFKEIYGAISKALSQKELISEASFTTEKEELKEAQEDSLRMEEEREKAARLPQSFETERLKKEQALRQQEANKNEKERSYQLTATDPFSVKEKEEETDPFFKPKPKEGVLSETIDERTGEVKNYTGPLLTYHPVLHPTASASVFPDVSEEKKEENEEQKNANVTAPLYHADKESDENPADRKIEEPVLTDAKKSQREETEEKEAFTPSPKPEQEGFVTKEEKKEKEPEKKPEQQTLFGGDNPYLTKKPVYRIIGQLFKTYWLMEFEDKLYIFDQHAAHEKILYERTLAAMREKKNMASQQISPAKVLTLTETEVTALLLAKEYLTRLGYEIEDFGPRTIKVSGVPSQLVSVDPIAVFIDILDNVDCSLGMVFDSKILTDRVATVSCKAAVKGNTVITLEEAQTLVDELMTLNNPYACPHGRPTFISMSRYEMEKKFKRVVTVLV